MGKWPRARPKYDIVECSRKAENPRCILYLAHVRGRDAVLEQSRRFVCRHHILAALEIDIADGALPGGWATVRERWVSGKMLVRE